MEGRSRSLISQILSYQKKKKKKNRDLNLDEFD